MHLVGSTVLPLVFHPEDRIRSVSLRIVQELQHGDILGAAFFRVNRSLLSFANDDGFKPSSGVPWVPFEKRGATNGGIPMSPPNAWYAYPNPFNRSSKYNVLTHAAVDEEI